MQRDEAGGAATVQVIEETEAETERGLSLEELVPDFATRPTDPEPRRAPATVAVTVPAPAQRPVASGAPVLRTARVVAVEGRRARVLFRGAEQPVEAALAPEVERDLIEEAASHKDAVLVESEGDGEPVVVGIVQTRRPREVRVTGEKIVVEGEREVLLRAGRAALRLREDGDIELVGSRISAASRGLFRIVGRILRLN